MTRALRAESLPEWYNREQLFFLEAAWFPFSPSGERIGEPIQPLSTHEGTPRKRQEMQNKIAGKPSAGRRAGSRGRPGRGESQAPPLYITRSYTSGLMVAFTTFIAFASATACATPASVSGNSSCMRSQGYLSTAR